MKSPVQQRYEAALADSGLDPAVVAYAIDHQRATLDDYL